MLEFKEFSARLKEDIAGNVNFQQTLKRLTTGKAETPRSWVYENEDPYVVLQTWISRLRKLEDEGGDLSEISEWDLSKQDKFAPQGEVAPFDQRLDTLEEYWSHLTPSEVFQTDLWKQAVKQAVVVLGFNHTGRPLSVDAVVKRGISEDKYNTSSGDPLCIKRKNPAAIEQASKAVLNDVWDEYYPILGSRASMGKTGAKARWIFMFPMSVNIQEQRWMYPVMEFIRKRKPTKFPSFFAPWEGYEEVQRVLSTLSPNTIKFGADYSKMDQHFNLAHGLQVFEVIKHYFAPEYWEELQRSITYVFMCPVITPKGLLEGPHAMPSGSGWTNFLETIFNFILWIYLSIKYGLRIKVTMGIGDDQLLELDYSSDQIEKLTSLVVENFKLVGLDANPEKQEVSSSIASFLQRRSYAQWKPNGEEWAGVYPTIRALTSEIFPEFYHNSKLWDKRTFALRCLMIIENCEKHPLFKEFCLFIAKGNENIVEFARSSDAEIILTRQRAKRIANFMPTYNQAKLNLDPTKFSSLKIIRDYYK